MPTTNAANSAADGTPIRVSGIVTAAVAANHLGSYILLRMPSLGSSAIQFRANAV